jgi:hypothetical protein
LCHSPLFLAILEHDIIRAVAVHTIDLALVKLGPARHFRLDLAPDPQLGATPIIITITATAIVAASAATVAALDLVSGNAGLVLTIIEDDIIRAVAVYTPDLTTEELSPAPHFGLHHAADTQLGTPTSTIVTIIVTIRGCGARCLWRRVSCGCRRVDAPSNKGHGLAVADTAKAQCAHTVYKSCGCDCGFNGVGGTITAASSPIAPTFFEHQMRDSIFSRHAMVMFGRQNQSP